MRTIGYLLGIPEDAQQAIRDRNVLLNVTDYAGQPITTYRGLPVAIVDQIVNNEATVS